jgi:hypothetical protein
MMMNKDDPRDLIESIIIIPGSGEFVYDTKVITREYANGYTIPLNMHNDRGVADVMLSIEHLKATLPNLKNVGLVVGWFATNIEAGKAQIIPKVEDNGFPRQVPGRFTSLTNSKVLPEDWTVAGIKRDEAEETLRIFDHSNLSAVRAMTYGGTPSDKSIINLCTELKKYGYNIMLYPMVFVDQITSNARPEYTKEMNLQEINNVCTDNYYYKENTVNKHTLYKDGLDYLCKTNGYEESKDWHPEKELKPWRGKIKANNLEDINKFFNGERGYNNFIKHYASLNNNGIYLKDLIDIFVIGSELKALTAYHGSSNSFPAVDQLKKIAAEVKAILGPKIKLTYAADWSEYHHTDGGWYNLDPLWSDPNIDMVGIDAYFPLTPDLPQNEVSKDLIKQYWEKGEGAEYYYSWDRSTKYNFDGPTWGWKNIEHWWNSHHYNPNGTKTSWHPKMKPVIFTEYGFPSLDGASNQPNVFYDPTSVESNYPRSSQGKVDFHAQAMAITATEEFWKEKNNQPGNKNLLPMKFLWTWDARPYPIWPQRSDAWADTANYEKGHWVQGKIDSTESYIFYADEL